MRDLDGYMGPHDERKTRWAPSRIEVWPDANDGDCKCPCNLAHPGVIRGSCSNDTPLAARAITDEVGNSFFVVPLCAICAAAQLSLMNKGRPDRVAPASESRQAAVFTLCLLALAVLLTWWFTDGGTAFALAAGLYAGVKLADLVD